MSGDTIGLILTAVGCTTGATWLIRSMLAKLEQALATHVQEDDVYHAKVIQFEKQRKRR